jgi:hypothetical protein
MALLNIITGGLAGRLASALPRTGQQTLPIEIPAAAGYQTLGAIVTLRNKGQVAGEFEVWGSVACGTAVTKNISLDPGQTATLTFSWQVHGYCVQPQVGKTLTVNWRANVVGSSKWIYAAHNAFKVVPLPPPPPEPEIEFVTVEYTPPA